MLVVKLSPMASTLVFTNTSFPDKTLFGDVRERVVNALPEGRSAASFSFAATQATIPTRTSLRTNEYEAAGTDRRVRLGGVFEAGSFFVFTNGAGFGKCRSFTVFLDGNGGFALFTLMGDPAYFISVQFLIQPNPDNAGA